MDVAYRDMFHDPKLCSYISRGGRLLTKSIVSQIGSHALVFQASAVAPVLSASAARLCEQIVDKPKDDDGAIIREWVECGCAFEAADSNEKGDKK